MSGSLARALVRAEVSPAMLSLFCRGLYHERGVSVSSGELSDLCLRRVSTGRCAVLIALSVVFLSRVNSTSIVAMVYLGILPFALIAFGSLTDLLFRTLTGKDYDRQCVVAAEQLRHYIPYCQFHSIEELRDCAIECLLRMAENVHTSTGEERDSARRELHSAGEVFRIFALVDKSDDYYLEREELRKHSEKHVVLTT